MSLRQRRARTLLIGLAAACLFAVPALAEPREISEKRAEVEQVLAQIEELDGSLGRAIEAYNAATEELESIEYEQEVNRRHLRIAKRNLKRQQEALARRLVSIYTSESDSSSLGVLLGASSFIDFVDRIDTVNRVSDQDTRVVHEVRQFRRDVLRHKRQLEGAHERQADLVSDRASQKASIEQQLAERRELVDSIRSEIERLEAEERARQAEIERQARARLAAEQAARALAREIAEQEAVDSAEVGSTESGDSTVYSEEEEELGVAVETPEASVAPPSQYGGVVDIAMQYLGVPYVWGGESPSGFDCSGFTLYVYAQIGISLPHYTGSQWQMGVPVSQDELMAGDLVFFNGLGHMGLYIGGGQFIHAPHTGDVVKISSLSDSWYASTYEGARRIL